MTRVQVWSGLYAGAMSTTRIRVAISTVAVSAVVTSGALAGCSISRDGEADTPPSSSSSEPTAPPTTAEPTSEPSTPEPSPPSPTPTPSASPAATPEGALLPAVELPPLNDASPWTEGRTAVPGQKAFGLCQQFDLVSIGAMDVIERTYSAGQDTAAEQVAEFPDAQNTVRASKVIEAWHRECADQVTGTHVNVRPITSVPVSQGKGSWYLVSYERRGEGHFHALGIVVSGKRMSLIRMDHDGQDHNYGPGQDPMELAVEAVSAKLG